MQHDQAEIARGNHEGLMELFMEAVPETIYVKDRSGRFLLANRALARHMGVDHPSKLVGLTDFDFYPESDARSYAEDERRIIETGRGMTDKVERCRTAEGRIVWFSTTKIPIRGDDGIVTGILGISRDVDERRRRELRCRGEASVLGMIAGGRPLPVVLDAIIRSIETQMEGVIASVLLLDAPSGRLRHGAAPGLPEAYVAAIDGVAIGPNVGSCGTAAHLRKRIVAEDVRTDPRWAGFHDLATQHGLLACWSQPILSSSGEVLGTFAMYYREPRTPDELEIEAIEAAAHLAGVAIERGRTAAEKEQMQRELQLLMDNMPDAIYFKDRDSAFTRVNPAQAAYLGAVDPADVIGRTDLEYLPRPVAEQCRADERAIIESGRPLIAKLEQTGRRNGAKRWFSTTKVPLHGEDGTVAGIVGISRDVTEYKKAMERLSSARDEVEQQVRLRTRELQLANERLVRESSERQLAEASLRQLESELAHANRLLSLGEMVAILTHELNQPLAAIVNYVDASRRILGRDGRAPVDIDQSLGEAADQALRAAEIIRRLRTFVRKDEASETDVDLASCIRDVIHLLEPVARHEGVTVEARLKGGPDILTDALQIQQVVFNLLRNAIEAEAEHAAGARRVLVETRHRPDGGIEVEITNHGDPIDDEEAARIFEPFVTSKRTGLGLGLSIARRIIESRAGRLSLMCAGGRVQFRFVLPARDTASAGGEPGPERD